MARLRDRASIPLKARLAAGLKANQHRGRGRIYWDEPEGGGGLGQIDCDGRDVCGAAGQTDWDDCACCGEPVGGGAGQAACDASGCCVAGFCAGPTVMRVGPDAAEAAGGFCTTNFGLGFGLGLVASAAAAGGVGPGTAASASGCSGGAW